MVLVLLVVVAATTALLVGRVWRVVVPVGMAVGVVMVVVRKSDSCCRRRHLAG